MNLRGSLLAESDWFQLPGVAIIDRRGIVRYVHRSRHAGDIPPIRALIDVIEGLG